MSQTLKKKTKNLVIQSEYAHFVFYLSVFSYVLIGLDT